MTTFVYLGPSLARADAQAILPAMYLDPIAMGDLYTLVRTRAKPGDRVAIIDGFFEQVPAVWHKEILYAISEGVTVYGASSMGALRAAELHPFGMRGVGRIYEAYRDLDIEDDDEVAVAHATREDGYRSLSTAMVSIRFGLAGLHEDGILSEQQRETLCAYAKSQHYNLRSWADVFAYAASLGMDDAILQAIRAIAQQLDAKALDALALLKNLAEQPGSQHGSPKAEFVLENTGFWRDLVQSQQARVARDRLDARLSDAAIDAELVRHVYASEHRDATLRHALLAKIAMESGMTSAPSAPEIKGAMFRIARENGLRSSAEMLAWRQEQRISADDWKAILDMDARVQKLTVHAINGLQPYLVATLKARGNYADALNAVTTIRDRYGEHWLKQLSADEFGIEYAELQRWYEKLCGPMLPDPETHAKELGFATLAEFVTHILAGCLLVRDVPAEPA